MITAFQPRYDRWVLAPGVCSAAVIVAVTALELTFGGWVLAVSYLTTATVLLVVLWSFIPRSYELWPDRFRIISGWPFSLRVPFGTVTEVYPPGAKNSLTQWGLKFAPSRRTTVKIKRSKGRDVVINPCDRTKFMEQVQVYLAEYRGRSGRLEQI
jgi:hypothetical protein